MTGRPSKHPSACSLIIDSRQADETAVGLIGARGRIVHIERNRSQSNHGRVLQLIERCLASRKISPRSVAGLLVVRGPGSFSSLRAGLTVAQTLSFAFNIPIAGVPADAWNNARRYRDQPRLGGTIRLRYGRPPSITKPKPR